MRHIVSEKLSVFGSLLLKLKGAELHVPAVRYLPFNRLFIFPNILFCVLKKRRSEYHGFLAHTVQLHFSYGEDDFVITSTNQAVLFSGKLKQKTKNNAIK